MNSATPERRPIRTGIADSLIVEIADHLARLAATGEGAAIDLRSLPMTAADRDDLEGFLGRGEVAAELDVAGKSHVWETRYAGVWWVRHLMADGRVATETIEIAPVPSLLAACAEDIATAARNLRHTLSERNGTGDAAEVAHVQ